MLHVLLLNLINLVKLLRNVTETRLKFELTTEFLDALFLN